MSNDWSLQLAEELHKPITRKFLKQTVISDSIDEIWAADLVKRQKSSKWNKGIKYLLMVIDVFSKYENEEKSSIVERWKKKMKNRMFKMFSVNNNTVYWDKLDKLVDDYNNTRHSSIKITPLEASKKENEKKVYFNLYSELIYLKPGKLKFQIGDEVRISKYKRHVFDKGYSPNWTEEIFVVNKILNTKPVTYKIVDLMGEEVKGFFYEKELQKAKQETFRIEKVLKRDNKKQLALVKWIGYPDKFNLWIKFGDLVDF